MLLENLSLLLSKSIDVLVEVNPMKAPIKTKINPANEKKDIIIPAKNKNIPADVPAGPNIMSSLFLVVI